MTKKLFLQTFDWPLFPRQIVFYFLIGLFLVGCVSHYNWTDQEQKIRQYFDMRPSQDVSGTTIQSAISESLPRGSSSAEVYNYLEKHGIGKDRFSHYDKLSNGEIICRVNIPTSKILGQIIVVKNYIIIFAIGSDDYLKGIEVKEGFTGL